MTDPVADKPEIDYAAGLVGWVEGYLKPWRDYRNSTHKTDWDLYQRMWRAQWSAEDKNRQSERSKLVSPGTMQAVDSTVSEIEEAILGQEQWFDTDQDVNEIQDAQKRQELINARDRLSEKFETYKVEAAAAKCFLIGSIYGTGIGKINTRVDTYRYVEKDPDSGAPVPKQREQVCVDLIPLEPYEFIPDPTTECIDEMLGCGHETLVPLHKIRENIKSGKYRKVTATGWASQDETFGQLSTLTGVVSKTAGLITEWHGLVPAKFLIGIDKTASEDEMAVLTGADEDDDGDLVEAIVTILNRSELLEAKPNPFFMKDRSFISYQHDTIPGYFWGRGVPEKALMSQRAKDAELRGRIDAMALVGAPMLAGDVTRLPRGFNLGVHPGKFWPTQGDPSSTIREFRFGDVNPSTFQASGEFDSMLQGATGAMDPITAFGSGQGPTDRGMASSALIKRSKRALKNIEREFLQPLVQKMMWRYMQFDSANFPQDYQFRVKGAMGVMAREIQAQQDIQLLSIVPSESPPFMALLKSIFANHSSPMKGELVAAVDKLLQPPDPQAQQEAQELKDLQKRQAQAAVAEQEQKARKAGAEAQLAAAKAADIPEQTHLEQMHHTSDMIGHAIDLKEANAFQAQVDVSQIMTHLRAAEIALKGVLAQVAVEKVKNEAKKLESKSL